MDNPINSVTSRIQGMQIGNLVKPKSIGLYRYHMMFDNMDSAWKLIGMFAPTDHPTLVTTKTRPNMYLLYDPTSSLEEHRKWIEWSYNEYATIENGYYGNNYFIFGSGKVFNVLPQIID